MIPWSLHDPRRRAVLARRIESVTPDAERRWGRMSADQMMWHLAESLAMANGLTHTKPRVTLARRHVFRWVGLYGPWPKGRAPTAPELKASEHYDLDAERHRLLELMDRLAAKPLDGAWPVHPGFGPMSGAQWTRLQARHIHHHLSQFGA